jgi:bifunctional ADP-heptose synthase (sugar kinase/adenylyltransferase)
MLNVDSINRVLDRLSSLTIGVLGDLFLDRYLDLDAALTEPSIETGLDSYQVVDIRSYPGAVGTIVNNLVALGVGRVVPVAVIGDDGEGYELRRALDRMPSVDPVAVITAPGRRTPTYTKPVLHTVGRPPRELNRLDIKNRTPTPPEVVERLLEHLHSRWHEIDALIVLDQVSEPDCGVVTARVRDKIELLGAAHPSRFILVDSRERIGRFRGVAIKPNLAECLRALKVTDAAGPAEWERHLRILAVQLDRPVFCTRGELGILLAEPGGELATIPGYPAAGPTDPVGAGDSTSAGIACAVAAGVTMAEAAAFGNLVASITVQQIGVTGTATPRQVQRRWRVVQDVSGQCPGEAPSNPCE